MSRNLNTNVFELFDISIIITDKVSFIWHIGTVCSFPLANLRHVTWLTSKMLYTHVVTVSVKSTQLVTVISHMINTSHTHYTQ